MFQVSEREKIQEICNIIKDRIENLHIGCFKGMEKPLFLISNTYPGVWLEHVYDSVFYAKLQPERMDLAVNTINLFLDHQKENGQLPCYVWNGDVMKVPEENLVGYGQIQECVSFAQLALEVCEMTGDRAFLEKVYEGSGKWAGWLKHNRMTTNRGLIELFVGFDTGHDNSGRLEGLSCPGNYVKDGVLMNASVLPQDEVAPILAVDMNANYFATLRALAKIAEMLGKKEEAAKWQKESSQIKEKLFEICFDEEDAFFYDVDKNGRKRKYLSSTILHLFLEKVLDQEADSALIKEIYDRHIKNPEEFWTEYPFPSMAVSDPSIKDHIEANCWGYFSQGLIALRCTRWMDDYGMSRDFDILCEKWLKAWTACFDHFKLGQELDPITGEPSPSSEWYSSVMLFYWYGARRLKIV